MRWAVVLTVPLVLAWDNLQVLPPDVSQADLEATMERMSDALGVSCAYCHVADRASDERAAKSTARDMIRMTIGLNRDYFEGKPKVTCATCHRGAPRPRPPARTPEPEERRPRPD